MNKILIWVLIAIIIIGGGYFLFKTYMTAPQTTNINTQATSSVQSSNGTISNGSTSSSPQASASGTLSLSALTPSNTADNSTTYTWNNFQFTSESKELRDKFSVTYQGMKVADIFFVTPPQFFNFNQQAYGLFEDSNCGNQNCEYWIYLYRFNQDGTLTSITQPSSKWLLSTDQQPSIDGATVIDGKLYILLGYGDSHDADVIDANGNFEMTITGSYKGTITPPNVAPPSIEQYLTSSRG